MQPKHLARPLMQMAICATVLWSCHPAAHAGTTAHRCTDAQGRVSYSQAPCRDAQEGATLTHIDDARTAAQRRQAEEAVQRDHMLEKRMARDRQHLAKQAEDQHVQRLNPTATKRVQEAKVMGSTDPHAPVHAYKCKPPRCYEARVPKARKTDNTSAASAP